MSFFSESLFSEKMSNTYEDKTEKVPLLNPVQFDGDRVSSQPQQQGLPRLGLQSIQQQLGFTGFSSALEDSPAYQVLQNLLISKYRLMSATDIKTIRGVSSRAMNTLCCLCGVCGVRTFEVPNGFVRLAADGSGEFLIYGAGVHLVRNPYLRLERHDIPLSGELIQHGDRTIVTVRQGHVGYCEDMGQPVLLPPGLHEWRSSTLKFSSSIDLNNTLIKLGPYTVLTVDEGYAAVTQNNGRQAILGGGKTHLLTHRNWKFEKFMTEKIQTDELARIEATSADNVKMHTYATVVWRVTDVQSAARMSAETMRHDGGEIAQADQSDMSKLRNDVLKQATASLACFIGEIRYSDSFHISAQVTRGREDQSQKAPVPDDLSDYSPIWDPKRMATAVDVANKVTGTYGVTILSINIISAIPADTNLQNALAKGAVASAEAEQAETIARGESKAARIKAEGDAQAEIIRAEGARTAAEKLASSDIAVELARIDKVGRLLGDKSTFFFGANSSSQELSALLSNPRIISK
eukprot:m.71894 g.71894  ORF g.71894 m.71894 type:complete len:521 (-) comp24404_c0_seq2:71-1633(-)